MPIRLVPLKSVPPTLLVPLTKPNPSHLLRPRKPDPVTSLLSTGVGPDGQALPPNLRLQDWADDRKRWEGIKADVRDGRKKDGVWVNMGLRRLLRER